MPRLFPRLVLVAVALYEIACFTDNLQMLDHQPLRFPKGSWPAIWQMFTLKSDGQENVWYEGRYGTTWVKLPMDEWYPAEWESGYRWERAAWTHERVVPYLQAACERSGAQEVRAVRLAWKRRLGSAAQFPRDGKLSVRGTRRCR